MCYDHRPGAPGCLCPAAEGSRELARLRAAAGEGAARRGWPAPVIYREDDGDVGEGRTPVLARLAAAIEAGRHDALLITDPGAVTGSARYLMGLLFRCTRNGVVVGLPPPGRARRAVLKFGRSRSSPAP